MLSTSVVIVATAEVGEGPFWQESLDSVHWVDIPPGRIMTTNALTGKTFVFQYHEMVGAAVPRREGGMVAAVQSGFVGFDEDWNITQSLELLGDGYRMNDAKTDPSGRFWAGSNTIDFVPGTGALWRLDEEWNAREVHSGLTLPNGIAWSPDSSSMFLVDSMQKIVLRFPFDAEASELAGAPEIFVGPDQFEGLPDGLCIDRRGHLWVAEFGASIVREFSPSGLNLSEIAIPTKQPTSCAFVGVGLTKMWVTSAAIGLDRTQDPHAGSIFEVTGFDSPGLPILPFRG